MVAGLIVLATTSHAEKTTTNAGAEKEATPTEQAVVAAPSAYYVMFSGKGWGIGRRASLALSALEGVKSITLSGLRATVKMNDGATLDEKTVTDVLVTKNLAFVSKAPAVIEEPKLVYVLNVTGVGWSDTEEKARVALGKVDNVTNVYVGMKTEVWMTEGAALDKDAITAMLSGFGIKLGEMEKTDKSAL